MGGDGARVPRATPTPVRSRDGSLQHLDPTGTPQLPIEEHVFEQINLGEPAQPLETGPAGEDGLIPGGGPQPTGPGTDGGSKSSCDGATGAGTFQPDSETPAHNVGLRCRQVLERTSRSRGQPGIRVQKDENLAARVTSALVQLPPSARPAADDRGQPLRLRRGPVLATPVRDDQLDTLA